MPRYRTVLERTEAGPFDDLRMFCCNFQAKMRRIVINSFGSQQGSGMGCPWYSLILESKPQFSRHHHELQCNRRSQLGASHSPTRYSAHANQAYNTFPLQDISKRMGMYHSLKKQDGSRKKYLSFRNCSFGPSVFVLLIRCSKIHGAAQILGDCTGVCELQLL